jgi:hypothetical protein
MLNFIKQCLAAFCIGAILFLLTTTAEAQSLNAAGDEGLVRVRSAYPVDATVARLRQDIAAKGITFFQEVDQAKLGAAARTAPPTAMPRQGPGGDGTAKGLRGES